MIFGIGFSKTGTTTLEKAVASLGYSVCSGHWNNNYSNYLIGLYVNKDLPRLFDFINHSAFDSFFDAPWGGTTLYRDIFFKYPSSKFILNYRDPVSWYKSWESMLSVPFESKKEFENNREQIFECLIRYNRFGTANFFSYVFDIDSLKNVKEKVVATYEEFYEEARSFLEENGADYIEIDVTKGEGWEKLSPFLGHDIPKTHFPHQNPGKNYKNLTIEQALALAHQNFSSGDIQNAILLCNKILEKRPSHGETQALVSAINSNK